MDCLSVSAAARLDSRHRRSVSRLQLGRDSTGLDADQTLERELLDIKQQKREVKTRAYSILRSTVSRFFCALSETTQCERMNWTSSSLEPIPDSLAPKGDKPAPSTNRPLSNYELSTSAD